VDALRQRSGGRPSTMHGGGELLRIQHVERVAGLAVDGGTTVYGVSPTAASAGRGAGSASSAADRAALPGASRPPRRQLGARSLLPRGRAGRRRSWPALRLVARSACSLRRSAPRGAARGASDARERGREHAGLGHASAGPNPDLHSRTPTLGSPVDGTLRNHGRATARGRPRAGATARHSSRGLEHSRASPRAHDGGGRRTTAGRARATTWCGRGRTQPDGGDALLHP
jgi:hypothetical protein